MPNASEQRRQGEIALDTQYARLKADRISVTATRLQRRIAERFPGRGLGAVAEEVCRLAQATADEAITLGGPNVGIRLGVAFLLLLLLVGVGMSVRGLDLPAGVDGMGELVQAIEAAVNDAVFVGIAVYFVSSLEGRWKRRRALAGLHALRSLAHVIDMHQLTKDPDRVLDVRRDTPSSPREPIDQFDLRRYLDYCSELLSLVGKMAALYAQHLDDPVVLEAVTEIEGLTTAQAGKIWQKLAILHARGAVPGMQV